MNVDIVWMSSRRLPRYNTHQNQRGFSGGIITINSTSKMDQPRVSCAYLWGDTVVSSMGSIEETAEEAGEMIFRFLI